MRRCRSAPNRTAARPSKSRSSSTRIGGGPTRWARRRTATTATCGARRSAPTRRRARRTARSKAPTRSTRTRTGSGVRRRAQARLRHAGAPQFVGAQFLGAILRRARNSRSHHARFRRRLQGAYSKNIGSRTYLLDDDETYKLFKLKNAEFSFDVDVSKLPCGLNGARRSENARGLFPHFPDPRARLARRRALLCQDGRRRRDGQVRREQGGREARHGLLRRTVPARPQVHQRRAQR